MSAVVCRGGADGGPDEPNRDARIQGSILLTVLRTPYVIPVLMWGVWWCQVAAWKATDEQKKGFQVGFRAATTRSIASRTDLWDTLGNDDARD